MTASPPTLFEAVKHFEKTQRELVQAVQLQRSPTQLGQSQALADIFAGRLVYVPELSAWYAWDGFRWVRDLDGLTVQAARMVITTSLARADADQDVGTRKKLVGLERAPAIRGVIELAAADPRLIRHLDAFDRDPCQLNTPSGLVDLRTATIRPARPEDNVMLITGVGPDLSAEAAPLFSKTILEIAADRASLAAWIIARMGYHLCGLNSLQDYELHLGQGSNGKTMLSRLRGALLGEYHHVVGADFFIESRFGTQGGPSPEILAVRGRRVLEASETLEGDRLNIARLKSLSGGDPLTARALHSNIMHTFAPTAKIIISTNHAPRLTRVDFAIARRTKLVPFDRQFSGAGDNPRLLDELLAEGPAIMAELVRAARAFIGSLSLPACQEIDAASKNYLTEEDPLARWLEERAIERRGALTPSSELYRDFASWMESEGSRPWTATAFGRGLSEKGFLESSQRLGGRRARQGIELQ